jgi:hypothetical protein
LKQLGVEAAIRPGRTARLSALLDSPKGRIELA